MTGISGSCAWPIACSPPKTSLPRESPIQPESSLDRSALSVEPSRSAIERATEIATSVRGADLLRRQCSALAVEESRDDAIGLCAPIARRATLLKLSVDDARFLFGSDSAVEAFSTARSWTDGICRPDRRRSRRVVPSSRSGCSSACSAVRCPGNRADRRRRRIYRRADRPGSSEQRLASARRRGYASSPPPPERSRRPGLAPSTAFRPGRRSRPFRQTPR